MPLAVLYRYPVEVPGSSIFRFCLPNLATKKREDAYLRTVPRNTEVYCAVNYDY